MNASYKELPFYRLYVLSQKSYDPIPFLCQVEPWVKDSVIGFWGTSTSA